jgi:hypothetical protein
MTEDTRKILVEEASEMGIPLSLLKNLTHKSIKKILDYEKEVKNGSRKVPATGTRSV